MVFPLFLVSSLCVHNETNVKIKFLKAVLLYLEETLYSDECIGSVWFSGSAMQIALPPQLVKRLSRMLFLPVR